MTSSNTGRGTGVELIAAERQRQIDQEGWTPEHDDQHRAGELGQAAACYADPGRETRPRWVEGISGRMARAAIPLRWPWEYGSWKPTPDDRLRELVKAGALIAAEIDRLQLDRLNAVVELPDRPEAGR
jgi:hypothetical protein